MLKYKVLLIGINYNGSTSKLNGCINDVINMKKYLLNEIKGLNEKDIVVLTDETTQQLPTRANIINSINWLVSNNDENSRLFFHYSGHGSNIVDQGVRDETDGRDETLVPLDYQQNGFIIDDELLRIMIEPLKPNCQLIAVFDCCHSGTILDLKYTYKFDKNIDKNYDKYTIQADAHYKSTGAKVVLISGCLDEEYSADSFEDGRAQGALTFCLLKTCDMLKTTQKTITYKNLMKNVYNLMKQHGYTQRPQISSGSFIDLGEKFLF
jgi:hypothetical protein